MSRLTGEQISVLFVSMSGKFATTMEFARAIELAARE